MGKAKKDAKNRPKNVEKKRLKKLVPLQKGFDDLKTKYVEIDQATVNRMIFPQWIKKEDKEISVLDMLRR
jgi:hypothetical protein